ncbi:Dihydrofolate reductase [Taphrina deformans PYCC 5710]|uniref:dihydrofolate reductase n=1 Tax=Taphrina deformans (strain PYCC 5710 / ATCC 11124 / CBS 356.35 / IMI 108563 / JCM 9778 / NBRC 8474) TaxID=1097556 RepID=R4XAK4_TAPDE|nr:Dihydrofolate reductase [Taphrina deformans PYCC 5710]|eukprot:CCG81333.1 Dihydrofolate reductase [Taphrina deformans PYCC 5710]
MTRILFLHGYTQSGNTLRHKTGALSKALSKYAEISYPTGIHKLEMPDPTNEEERERLAKLGNEEGEGSFAWWRADHDRKEFVGLQETVDSMKRILETEGPFDGVMGFSQGGGFAAILTSLLERPNKMLDTTHPPFKFAVIFSGFRSYFPQHEFLYQPKIQTPMLHVIGKVDPIVTPERSQDLVDASGHAETLVHPGSHFVPSAAPYKARIVDFVLSHTRPRRSCTAIVAATENGLGIGKDGGLPWRLKKEMRYFADVTTAAPEGRQNVVIMGRNSWTSIPPKFRPLKGRINIIVTSDPGFELTGTAVKSQHNALATSLDDALLQVEKQFADVAHRVFIIGGAQLYRAALSHPALDRILYTAIRSDFACDVHFPIDFRRRQQQQAADSHEDDADDAVKWRRKSLVELRDWTGQTVPDSDSEGQVTWGYEMWEREGGDEAKL